MPLCSSAWPALLLANFATSDNISSNETDQTACFHVWSTSLRISTGEISVYLDVIWKQTLIEKDCRVCADLQVQCKSADLHNRAFAQNCRSVHVKSPFFLIAITLLIRSGSYKLVSPKSCKSRFRSYLEFCRSKFDQTRCFGKFTTCLIRWWNHIYLICSRHMWYLLVKRACRKFEFLECKVRLLTRLFRLSKTHDSQWIQNNDRSIYPG